MVFGKLQPPSPPPPPPVPQPRPGREHSGPPQTKPSAAGDSVLNLCPKLETSRSRSPSSGLMGQRGHQARPASVRFEAPGLRLRLPQVPCAWPHQPHLGIAMGWPRAEGGTAHLSRLPLLAIRGATFFPIFFPLPLTPPISLASILPSESLAVTRAC